MRICIMHKLYALIIIILLTIPVASFAKTIVVEGDEAKKLYETEKSDAKVLVQKNKEFILRMPDGTETKKPPMISLKAGERFYIVNEEDTFVHNVYDISDSEWVLKKQVPSNIAGVTFDTPEKHGLRCAMHPAMKIEVEVTE